MSAPTRFADALDTLHDEARAATGLEDFGDPAYLEGLERLLASLDGDASLSPLGRAIHRGEIVKILSTRLRVEQRLAEHEDALARPVRRPIVITGLVRTGSTALHYLMGQDEGVQKLEYWLASEPQPRPPRETWDDHPDFARAAAELDFLYRTTPDLMAVHEMRADWPEECRHVLALSFTDDRFETSATLPAYDAWYHDTRHDASYRRHREVLQLIAATDPERRWLLKYPVHLRQLDALFSVYPDACVVQTHRDPCTVIASYASFITKIRRMHQKDVDPAFVAREQMESWAHAAEAGMRHRDAYGSDRFYDLRFADFMVDPIGSVQRIYERFDQPLSADDERRIRAWHDAHPQGRHGRHEYDETDFGIPREEIRERFAAYIARYGLDEPEDGATRSDARRRAGSGHGRSTPKGAGTATERDA